MSSGDVVLVTGGAGYIGAHACKALARAGLRPVTLDDLSTGHREAVRWGPLEIGDVADRVFVDDAIARHRPSCVMHFAARAYVGESVADPARYYAANVIGTLALLDAMRARGLRRIVFSSSCAVYGAPARVPIDERAPAAPINPYGRTKLIAEWALADHAAAYGLAWIALRYFNAAGADPEGEIGEDHDPEPHLIPLALRAALPGGAALRIMGTDYDTPDGTAIRDYVHVADLAEAHVAAVRHLARGGESGSFNVGAERGHSVREIVAAAARVTGRAPAVENAPRRAGDPPRLIADARRAREILGFAPRRSAGIDEIVADSWRWIARRHNAG
ncbi:MAG: UDP-glucose 4-epimerase GalE [Tagaea sp.]|nr:UDP-glucose 4-epimerase GalE [Tagaea sp.]